MVGGGYHVDVFIGCVVEHAEELVNLSVLIVVIIIAPLRDHAVKLIEEKQGGSLLLGFPEKLTNLGLCSVYIGGGKVVGYHFHKVDTDFLGHLFREKGLSHTCGPIEKQTRRFDAESFCALLISQDIDEALLYELFKLVHSSDVFQPSSFCLLNGAFGGSGLRLCWQLFLLILICWRGDVSEPFLI